ncbi:MULTISPECIES: 4'-phosphopantetheinyl transferase [Rhizobium/Agrobacterium group]|uniref:4'-phosphopantetheinyl transferase family protein n=1 Tax=Rhizobium/Agrobacterium group TaxID=227290 RepID=UPI0013E2FC33|nr:MULTISPECIES: 4'-phosphopantetheinyl transferase superfamily protein [Rhizobium/Agrobacterium group]WHO77277.1 4'-phosphopantetheinyl transferase superfamily protein [Rhizobium sp. BT03]
MVGVIGKICDYTQELYARELAHLERAVEKRRIEYATGRHFARVALASMGHAASPIMTGEFRQPIWPKGIVGSIAHSQTLALVVVTKSDQPFRGIGIDIEAQGSVSSDFVHEVLTDRELANFRTCGIGLINDATLIFSAKEAVFKAVNPITNVMIDFNEAEIHVDPRGRTFRANYVGEDKINGIMNSGIGSYSLFENHFVSFFGIPSLSLV